MFLFGNISRVKIKHAFGHTLIFGSETFHFVREVGFIEPFSLIHEI
jgi:hypothetical protein